MKSKIVKCLTCYGQGRTVAKKWGLGLLMRKYQTCPTCKGTGTEEL